MASSIFQQLNNNNNNFFQNPQDLINNFNNFREMLQGDPVQIGQQLLQSGKMSPQTYNQLKTMANQIMPMLQMKK